MATTFSSSACVPGGRSLPTAKLKDGRCGEIFNTRLWHCVRITLLCIILQLRVEGAESGIHSNIFTTLFCLLLTLWRQVVTGADGQGSFFVNSSWGLSGLEERLCQYMDSDGEDDEGNVAHCHIGVICDSLYQA